MTQICDWSWWVFIARLLSGFSGMLPVGYPIASRSRTWQRSRPRNSAADHNLNVCADAGSFLTLSRAINLGNASSSATRNGMNHRVLLWTSCRSTLGGASCTPFHFAAIAASP
ncbi:hypothetical protein M3A49_40925 [Paraburkholderia sp. CNPSo 3076]|uniref:hypothetical protein n=1 Tax=Paraburkholderia sp. CNPSo 3076 TaxID=2940936 RepID=UPI00224CAB88|nr:hypothetical protein [Paraburkholderia sp. CNPSo 3076]MCX5545706.1 hypothetical protein [Paraburkholderia sp. CNPSo 3076]